MSDTEIVRLYRCWSESMYAAGFMIPSPEAVRDFRHWLRSERPADRFDDNERRMLVEFRQQEWNEGRDEP